MIWRGLVEICAKFKKQVCNKIEDISCSIRNDSSMLKDISSKVCYNIFKSKVKFSYGKYHAGFIRGREIGKKSGILNRPFQGLE